MRRGTRFTKGDHVIVRDKGSNIVRASGIALQTRDHVGWAMFQVLVNEVEDDGGWAYTFDLNFVDVEVL